MTNLNPELSLPEPSLEALAEVVKAHEQLDPPGSPIVLASTIQVAKECKDE